MKDKQQFILLLTFMAILFININDVFAFDFNEKYKYELFQLPAGVQQDGIQVDPDACKTDLCEDLKNKIKVLKKNLPDYCSKLNSLQKNVNDEDILTIRNEIKDKKILLKKAENENESIKIENQIDDLEYKYIELLKQKSPEIKDLLGKVNLIIDHIYKYEDDLQGYAMDEFWANKDINNSKIDNYKQNMYSDETKTENTNSDSK